MAAVQTTAPTLHAVTVPRRRALSPAPPAAPPLAAAEPPPPIPSLASSRPRSAAGVSAAKSPQDVPEARGTRGSPRSRAGGAARGRCARTPRPWAEAQVGADLDAGGVARLGGLHEADAGAHEQRLDRGDADVVGVGEVGVGQALELAHQQRRALLLGQAPHVGDQAAEVLAALGLGQRVLQRGAGRASSTPRAGGDRAPQLVDAAVVGDAVEPGAQRDRPVGRRAARRRRARRRPAARPRRPWREPDSIWRT